MYLIIERDFNGDIYAYFEKKSVFKKVQSARGGLNQLSGKALDNECLLDEALPRGNYMIIPVIAKTAPAKRVIAAKKTKPRKKSNGKKTKVSRS